MCDELNPVSPITIIHECEKTLQNIMAIRPTITDNLDADIVKESKIIIYDIYARIVHLKSMYHINKLLTPDNSMVEHYIEIFFDYIADSLSEINNYIATMENKDRFWNELHDTLTRAIQYFQDPYNKIAPM